MFHTNYQIKEAQPPFPLLN
jgi:hypothetical protein